MRYWKLSRVSAVLLAVGVLSSAAILSAANDSFPLTVSASTTRPALDVLTWPAQAGVDGFRIYRDGERVSTSVRGDQTSTTIWRGSSYTVESIKITPVASGSWPGTTTPPPPPTPPETVPTVPVPPTPPPTPTPSDVVQLSGSMSPSAFVAAAGSKRPVTLRGPVTVTGALNVPAGVRVERATVNGDLTLGTGASFDSGSANSFRELDGQDGWTISNSVFDGRGGVAQNLIWDTQSGDGSTGWKITGSTIKNFYMAGNPAVHSEGIFIGGGSRDGLIEGNTFSVNGNTAHIFFSWFGGSSIDRNGNMVSNTGAYPRGVCVRGNTFLETAYGGTGSGGAYYSVDWRTEIPSSSGNSVSPDNRNLGKQALSSRPEFTRAC